MQDYSGYGQPPYGGYGATPPLPPMPPRPPRRRIGLLSYLAVALVAGALGAGSVVALYHPASSNNSAAAQPAQSGQAPQAPEPLPTGALPVPSTAPSSSVGVSGIVSKVEPGLVIINTTLSYRREQAAGTGMVIRSDGLVLTNNHVIEDATRITATLVSNGRTYPARVLGYDVTGDIALIQLEGVSGLHTVQTGDSSTVRTGQPVVAMGNAQGQSMIVPATGQVTGLNQTITATDQGGSIHSETLHGMIETDAAVVSGDSGGPLANTAGQVIGMNTAGNEVRFGNQSEAGFAIPINTALAVAGQIEAGRASSTINIGYPPFMGILITGGNDSSPQDQAAQQGNDGGFGVGFGNGNSGCVNNDGSLPAPSTIAPVSSGTLILGVICGGSAAGAGITAGSVITAVNGQAIGSPDDLTSVVSKYRPGETIAVTWVSPSGQRTTSSIQLSSGPPL